MIPLRIAQPLDIDRLPSSDELIYDDGEPMESARHVAQMLLLIDSLECAWRERTDFYVAGNMFLYFSEAQVKHNDFRGPDVFVVMNTTRRERKSWVLWEEDFRAPNVVIELLSDSTAHVDRGEKKDIYARVLEVPEYVLFDPFSGELEGYELDARRGVYVRKPEKNGHVHCAQLGLSLAMRHSTHRGMEADWLRWFGPDGRFLPGGAELADAERRRANTEKKRANTEKKRANTEKRRADSAEDRADRAEQRASHEARRAHDAERREEAAHRQALLRLLALKFGPLSDQAQERISRASTAQLQRWIDRVMTADTLQDVFKDE